MQSRGSHFGIATKSPWAATTRRRFSKCRRRRRLHLPLLEEPEPEDDEPVPDVEPDEPELLVVGAPEAGPDASAVGPGRVDWSMLPSL